jgi:hypothetical protein
MKAEFAAVDAALVIRKLRRALYSARARARSWREVAKRQREVFAASQIMMAEVQRQRDFLLNRANQQDEAMEELRAYNRVLQWRVDSAVPAPPAIQRCDPPPPDSHVAQAQQLTAQLQNAQYAQAMQQLAMQSQQNTQNQQLGQYHNILGTQLNSPPLDWCNCVPARHDMLIPPR